MTGQIQSELREDRKATNSRELAEITEHFNGQAPLIFRVMEEKQLLANYWPMVKDALFEDTGIGDQRVREGLMVTFSTQCDNKYCFVAHSCFLHSLGFTVDAIETMVKELRFPEQVDEHEKWSLALKWAFLFGRPPGGASGGSGNLNKFIQKLISPTEYKHLFKICTVIDMLNRFSEFYEDNVRIGNEEMFHVPSVKLPIPELVKYYEKLARSDNNVKRPVITICSYCKSIKDVDNKWHVLESVISSLERNSLFSHGICPDCYEKALDD